MTALSKPSMKRAPATVSATRRGAACSGGGCAALPGPVIAAVRPVPRSQRNDALADSVLGQLDDTVHTELAFDIAPMHLDGAHRDVQGLGNRR
jgi:hypothetical protein